MTAFVHAARLDSTIAARIALQEQANLVQRSCATVTDIRIAGKPRLILAPLSELRDKEWINLIRAKEWRSTSTVTWRREKYRKRIM
jgi:hypothetical protein